MQGNMVNAIATQNMAGVVSIGDSITVVNVIYNHDTPKCFKYPEFGGDRTPLYTAKKGTLKTSVIHNNTTGKQFPEMVFGYSPLSSWLKRLD